MHVLLSGDDVKVRRIALTGGIACGKSLAARFLRELGFETVDADDIVHELIPDPAERRRIAAEVFSDPEKRRALEAEIHPKVKAKINAFFAEGADGGSPRIAIVPLLFEAHWDAEYDIICTIASEPEAQISRMTANRGYTREEAEMRMAAQMPVAEKSARSHYTIHNNGTERDLRDAVGRFADWLKNT